MTESLLAVINDEQYCEEGRGGKKRMFIPLRCSHLPVSLCLRLEAQSHPIAAYPEHHQNHSTWKPSVAILGLPLCLLVYHWGTLRSTSNEPKTESLPGSCKESLCHPTAATCTRTVSVPSETAGIISPIGQGSSDYCCKVPNPYHFLIGF